MKKGLFHHGRGFYLGLFAMGLLTHVSASDGKEGCLRAGLDELLNDTVKNEQRAQSTRKITALLREKKVPEKQIEVFIEELKKAELRCKR